MPAARLGKTALFPRLALPLLGKMPVFPRSVPPLPKFPPTLPLLGKMPVFPRLVPPLPPFPPSLPLPGKTPVFLRPIHPLPPFPPSLQLSCLHRKTGDLLASLTPKQVNLTIQQTILGKLAGNPQGKGPPQASQEVHTTSREGNNSTTTPTRHPQGSSKEEPNPKWVINLSNKPLTPAQRSVSG